MTSPEVDATSRDSCPQATQTVNRVEISFAPVIELPRHEEPCRVSWCPSTHPNGTLMVHRCHARTVNLWMWDGRGPGRRSRLRRSAQGRDARFTVGTPRSRLKNRLTPGNHAEAACPPVKTRRP